MKLLKSLGHKVLMISFILYTSALAYGATVVGKFTYVSGRVDVTSPGKKAVPAKLGMEIAIGDIIRAKSNSKAEVLFKDGNILRIAQNTRVEITKYMIGKDKSNRILNLFRGNIQNIVKKMWTKKIAGFIKNHKYEVHTPIAVVGVKGTNFFTFHTRMGSGAIFKEGTGYCYARKRPQRVVYIFPGQKVIIPSATAVPIVKPASKREIQRFESQTAPKRRTKRKGAPKTGKQGGEAKVRRKGAKGGAPAPGGEGGVGGEEAGAPPPAETEPGAGGAGEAGTPPAYAPAGGEERAGQEPVYIPVTETEPTKTLDTTPPTIRITKKPDNPTNSNRATFEWESNEPATYYYRLDNGDWVSTKETSVELPDLTEGEHTFEVKAVDESGNSSDPVTYDWRTDYTSPTVEVEPKSSPQSEPDKSEVQFTLTSNEPTTYYWNFDGNTGTAQGTTLTFEDVDEGTHNFSFTAEDEAGNTTNGEILFELKRYRLKGSDVVGEGSSYGGTASGAISAVIDNDWGGWELNAGGSYGGPHTDSWQLITGGGVFNSQDMWRGYWIYGADGDYQDSDMIGLSALKVLTYHSLGKGEGFFLGKYDENSSTWQGSDSGDYSHDRLIYSGKTEFADNWNLGPYWGLYGTSASGNFDSITDTSALIGGIVPPWEDSPSIYIMGEIYDKVDPQLSYIWNNDIYSYNWDNETHSTYDGGVFKGFIGGVWTPSSSIEGDIDARIVAIYRDPNGNIGYLTGDVEGSYWPDLKMLWAKGSYSEPHVMGSWPGISPEGFYNSIRTDKNMSAKLKGGFGPEGDSGFIDGISFAEGSWTRYLDGESWGIYDLIIDGHKSYENPSGQNSWIANMGGDAYFGTYISNNGQYKPDYGYWMADLTEGIWEDGKLTADITGRFLTLTKKGSMNGKMFGYYNEAGSTWAGTGLGIYKGDVTLDFSSYIRDGKLSAITSATLHEGAWQNSSTHKIQRYEYISDGYGWGYKEIKEDTVLYTEYLLDHTYLKWEKRGDGKPPIIVDSGPWPEGFQISSLGDNPDPSDPNWTRIIGDSESASNILADAGSFDLILGGYVPEGGPSDLWHSAQQDPVPISLMGSMPRIADRFKDDHWLFYSVIKSYNPYDLTDTTPDGGAYWGWIGGIMDDVEGSMLALYIDPSGNAGVLQGSFFGKDYRSIHVFEAQGFLYAKPMTNNILYTPSELIDHIIQDHISGDLYGNFGNNSEIRGSGSGHLAYIEGEDWGIYELIFGKENTYNNSGTVFNAKVGGIIPFQNGNFSYFISDIGGAWDNDRLNGFLFLGYYLSMTNKGEITGSLIGTYREDSTWQGILLGEWKDTDPLTFATYIDTRVFNIISGTLHEGESDNTSTGEIYEYEYISEGTGYAFKETTDDTDESTFYFPFHRYITLNYGSNGRPPSITDRGVWPDDFKPEDVSNPPSGFSEPQESSSTSSILKEQGFLTGIMGGTESIWNASSSNPIRFELLGHLTKDEDVSSLFVSDIKSYNIDLDTFTTFDGGAYIGFLGGIADDIQGKIYALYIDPTGGAGYLKGDFGGPVYGGIEMWEAGGNLYPVEKVQNVGILASALSDNTFKGSVLVDEAFGYFTDGVDIWGQVKGRGFGNTLSIVGQDWGVYHFIFGIDTSWLGPVHDFVLKTGGLGEFGSEKDLGFWIADINGNWSENKISGVLEGNFLTMRKWGSINGDLLGSYGSDNGNNIWQSVSLGYWEKGNSLYFASYTEADAYHFNGTALTMLEDTEIPGAIMGGLNSIWDATADNPAQTKFLGKVEYGSISKFVFRNRLDVTNNKSNFVSYNVNTESFITLDQSPGSYTGFLGGMIDLSLVDADNVKGLVTALYVDSNQAAGVLLGDFSGTVYPEIEMWKADGSVYPVQLNDNVGFSASALVDNVSFSEYDSPLDIDQSKGTFESGGSIRLLDDKTRNAHISNEDWSIWQDLIGGTFDGNTSDSWEAYAVAADYSWQAVLTGNKWSENIIKSEVAGSWVSWDQAITGVSGGKLVGTFDPSNPNWQAVAQGVGIETRRFLEMIEAGELEKLKNLNIPCYEVGRTDLTGSVYTDSVSLTVNIKHVIFLAPSTGGPAKIWASAPTTNDPQGGVSGTYTGTPAPGFNVPLTGQNSQNCSFGPNSVNFTIQRWQSGKWGAVISGAGSIKDSNVNIKGAAAGTYAGGSSGGSFGGTASGIVQKQ